MILRLRAIFSFIDTKLHFAFDDEEALQKLHTNVKGEHLPYDTSGFTVAHTFGQSIPADVAGLVGRLVDVWVKPMGYSFISKATHNAGQRITGIRLILDDIRAADQLDNDPTGR